MWLPALAWWVYLVIALSLFIGCLSLNFIAKKINETRMDERLTRITHKVSASQSTQVQYPLIEMETGIADDIDPATQGISLVFDKEENLLNEQKRTIDDDLMHHVEQIIAKVEDNIVEIKECEANSEKITDSEVMKQSETNSEKNTDSDVMKHSETNSAKNTYSEVMKQSETISEKMTDSESGIDVIIKPTFLGHIYKSVNNSMCNYRMNRDNQEERILNDVLDDIMSKVKATSSMMKCNVPNNTE